ncbi:unnamed protein product [Moneuplotes crassus]|uniref:Uncharacterized protein n=1 Tax=Euplotes crassus TaxID=5936 RepID=A0AAD1UPY2_EUPCR|nr:unnamed protein product [Moneuplotes crassus]
MSLNHKFHHNSILEKGKIDTNYVAEHFKRKKLSKDLGFIEVVHKVSSPTMNLKLTLKTSHERYKHKPLKLNSTSSLNKRKPKNQIILYPKKSTNQKSHEKAGENNYTKTTKKLFQRRSNRSSFKESSLLRIYSINQLANSSLSSKKSQSSKLFHPRKGSTKVLASSSLVGRFPSPIKTQFNSYVKENPLDVFKNLQDPQVGNSSQIVQVGQHTNHRNRIPLISLKKTPKNRQNLRSILVKPPAPNAQNASKSIINTFTNSIPLKTPKIQPKAALKTLKTAKSHTRNPKPHLSKTVFNNVLLKSIITPADTKFDQTQTDTNLINFSPDQLEDHQGIQGTKLG